MKRLLLLLLLLSTPAHGQAVEGWTWNPLNKILEFFVPGLTTPRQVDDVIEGFFSPRIEPSTGAFGGVTYVANNSVAYFKKSGRTVYINGQVVWSAATVGTASGNLRIAGFPYVETVGSLTGNHQAVIPIMMSNIDYLSTADCVMTISNNNNFGQIQCTQDNDLAITLQAGIAASAPFNKGIWFTGTYLTDR